MTMLKVNNQHNKENMKPTIIIEHLKHSHHSLVPNKLIPLSYSVQCVHHQYMHNMVHKVLFQGL